MVNLTDLLKYLVQKSTKPNASKMVSDLYVISSDNTDKANNESIIIKLFCKKAIRCYTNGLNI